MEIDQAKLERFMGQALGELGAGMNAALVIVGDKLGLYKAMAGAGPMTFDRIGAEDRHHGTLCARMAERSSRRRIRHLRCEQGTLHAAERAGTGAGG